MQLLSGDGTIRNHSNDPVWQKFHGHDTSSAWMDQGIDRLKLMAQDPVSGPGHYLFLPRGAMMFNLLKAYLYDLYAEFGCFYLESPILTDYEHPAVRNHAEQSGEKTYHTTSSGRHLVTKIGALYSQLEYVNQRGLPSHAMPLKLFEMTKCCRIEDRVSPLRRSSEFTMVDMHELCKDLAHACDEAIVIHRRILELGREFDLDLYSTFTVTDAFLATDLAYLSRLAHIQGKEALLLSADPAKGRPLNLEYHVDAGSGPPLEIAAFQIDELNPKNFGIQNVDTTWPILIHANIVGSVERFMYALLVKVIEKKAFPLWLAPEQIRLIPRSPVHAERCHAMARDLKERSLRVTVDDRHGMEVTDKVRAAQEAMVSEVILVDGDGSVLSRVRDGSGSTAALSMADFVAQLDAEIHGKPRMGATFPVRLSRWPDYF
jgi:threonyl-tRNA synthetase